MGFAGKTGLVLLMVTVCGTIAGCGVRSLPKNKNKVEATLAEITNQYKRRADLIPNLVQTVKGYAAHEASATTIDPSKLSGEQVEKFQAAQGSLSQALGKLMVVVEKYPDLKADQNFRELQAQLEGTENRITVARNRNIEAIKEFNDLVTAPPESWTNSLFYKFEKMPQWTVDDVEKAKNAVTPKVEF
jgi:LemA protein